MTWLLSAAFLIGSLVLSALGVALSIWVSHKFEVFDYPDESRKQQAHPIPKLGGLAVAASFTVVTVIGFPLLGHADQVGMTCLALVPALFAAGVGYVDDLRHLQPKFRLAMQAAAGVLAWALGTRIAVSGSSWIDLALTVAFIMVVINGINLLDNSDGLAGSTVLLAGAGSAVVALIFGQELVSLLGFALIGTCVGFLWHNWFPAKVYLGDSGAYFLGMLLSVLVIRLQPSPASPIIGILIALLLVALPILDTSYVVVSRLARGVHPFTAGRDHLSHRLQNRGWSVAGSVSMLQIVPFFTSCTAVLISVVTTHP